MGNAQVPGHTQFPTCISECQETAPPWSFGATPSLHGDRAARQLRHFPVKIRIVPISRQYGTSDRATNVALFMPARVPARTTVDVPSTDSNHASCGFRFYEFLLYRKTQHRQRHTHHRAAASAAAHASQSTGTGTGIGTRIISHRHRHTHQRAPAQVSASASRASAIDGARGQSGRCARHSHAHAHRPSKNRTRQRMRTMRWRRRCQCNAFRLAHCGRRQRRRRRRRFDTLQTVSEASDTQIST